MIDLRYPFVNDGTVLDGRRRYEACRQLSSRIGKRRIIARPTIDDSSSSTTPPNRSPQEIRIVTQNNNNIDGTCDYGTVEFLQHSVLMTFNQKDMSIDLIKLSSSSLSSDTSNTDDGGFITGTKIASGVEMNPRVEGDPFSSESCVQMKALQGGRAFAVGHNLNGEMRIYETEHADAAGTSCSWRCSLSQSQTVHQNTASTGHTYPLKGYRMHGPRRRYERAYTDSLSLTGMLSDSDGYPQVPSLSEITNWNDRTTVPCRRNFVDSGPNSRHWAFLETSSSVQAVFLDPDNDCFSLRLLDNRSKPAPVSSRPCIVIVDEEAGPTDCVDSICFAGDLQVMSSTRSRVTTQTCVKLWDLRQTRRPCSTIDVVLPSFPLDRIHQASAVDIWYMKASERGERSFLIGQIMGAAPDGRKRPANEYVSNMFASDVTNSRDVILETKEVGLNGVCRYWCFDPVMGKIQEYFGEVDRNTCALAVSPDLLSVAVHKKVNATDYGMEVLDLKRTRDKFRWNRGERNATALRGTKRKKDDRTIDRNGNSSSGAVALGTVDSPFEEQIQSLVFNEAGNLLVGYSVQSGQLVLWGC